MALPDYTTQTAATYKANIDSTASDHETRLDAYDLIPIYGLVILNTPVSLVTNTATTTTTQTAVDITAQTTGVAVKAILRVQVYMTSAASPGNVNVYVGEGDETLSAAHLAAEVSATNSTYVINTNTVYVNLASGEIFDYSITVAGAAPSSTTTRIYLVGYYV